VPAWAQPQSQPSGRQQFRLRGEQTRGPASIIGEASYVPLGHGRETRIESPSASPPMMTRNIEVPRLNSSSNASSGLQGSPTPFSPVPRWDEMLDQYSGRACSAPRFIQEARGQALLPECRWQVLGSPSEGSRRVFDEPISGLGLQVDGVGTLVEEFVTVSATSPTSTVDLHGPADHNVNALNASAQQLGRTNSAPDSLQSLLSGGGGLELSDSLSHPSLTMSTNSSKEANGRPSDSSSRRGQKDLGPSSPGLAMPASAASTGEDLASAVVISPARGRRTPEIIREDQARPTGLNVLDALEAVNATDMSSPADVLKPVPSPRPLPPDENAPPELAAAKSGKANDLDDVTSSQPQLAGLCGKALRDSRETVVKQQISYWEERVRHKSLEGSPEILTPSGSRGSLRERNSLNLQERGQLPGRSYAATGGELLKVRRSSGRKMERTPSTSMARHAGVISDRTKRQVERQRRAAEDLARQAYALGCEDSDEINQLLRSSGSESETPDGGSMPDDEDGQQVWCRALDDNFKAQQKAWRKVMRLYEHCIKKRLAAPRAPVCGQCNHPCPRCTSTIMADTGGSAPQATDLLATTVSSAPAHAENASVVPKSAESRREDEVPFLAAELSTSAEPFQVTGTVPTSPTEPSQAQEEEPHGEPDSGLLVA